MIKPANKSTLYENVLEQMLEAVKKGAWKPGEKIPGELALAEIFQVSRNCIREVLKALSIYNIVESRSGDGTYISANALRYLANNELVEHLSENVSIRELMEIRILLETQIVEWVIERATEEDLETLKEIVFSERDNKNGTINPSSHSKFHEYLAEIARNSLAVKILASIREEINAQRYRYTRLPLSSWQEMMTEHEAILNCILNRDVVKARESVQRHIEHMLKSQLLSLDAQKNCE